MYSYCKYFFLILSIGLLGCASYPKNKNPRYEKINSDKKIKYNSSYVPSDLRKIQDIPQFTETVSFMAPGFLFSVVHPSDEKIRGEYRVQFDGLLRLPYGIRINVTGKSFNELKNEVMASYKKFFQRGAEDITFTLLQKRYWVEVRGFVKKSGYYLVNRKESIDKVIDKAGGLIGNLKKDFVTVSIKQKEISYSVSLNQYYSNNVTGDGFTWLGGDTLFINTMNDDINSPLLPTVSVLGGVLTPGKILFRENANIYYYLQKTGGIIPNLGYEECYVVRKVKDKFVRINFDITDMDTLPVVKAGDVIMMTAEKKTLADRIWDRATQVGAILTSFAIIILAL